MAKIKITATELTDVDVRYVSLVKRGANRIPFRIIKQECTDMGSIDLSKFRRIFKREETPEQPIKAFVVAKEDLNDAVEAILKDAGYVVDQKEEQDNCIILKQADSIGETEVIQINDRVAVLVDDTKTPQVVEKSEEVPSPFLTAIRDGGFLPSISPATYYLDTSCREILNTAKSADEAKSAIAAVLQSFNTYITDLVEALPVQVFSIAKSMVEAMPEAKTEGQEESVTKDETHTEESQSTETQETEGSTKEEATGGAMEGDSALDAIHEKLGTLSALVDSIGDTLKGIKPLQDTLASLATRMESVEKTSKESSDAMSRLIVGSTPSGDGAQQTSKESTVEEVGYLDTAFVDKRKKVLGGANR